ncbi:hypothetical protein X12_004531 (plasmid) [Xanthomonas arboricola]|uniref:hypothetical protein n=1 Tax=Xanthomonas arboricola TaxID=56448 RepID=UPI002B2BC590|nr:hypothetical protein X12_004531 [Xanthomonas arboricola]
MDAAYELLLSDIPYAKKAEIAARYADEAESDEEREAWRELEHRYNIEAADEARTSGGAR